MEENKTKKSMNIKLIFGIVILLILPYKIYAQEYEIKENSITGIFEIKGKDKSEIFSSINKWISINYNSANNVIQMNDKESGTMIVKGANTVWYKTNLNFENPNFFPNKLYIDFKHLIEINVQDNRFRVIYTLIDIDDIYCVASKKWSFYVYKQLYRDSATKCVNLKGSTEESISDYNKSLEKYLDAIWTNKKNKNMMFNATESIFNEMNEEIKSDILSKIKSIQASIISDKKDDW